MCCHLVIPSINQWLHLIVKVNYFILVVDNQQTYGQFLKQFNPLSASRISVNIQVIYFVS
jgi:hypothetical protein